jgi:hypothetical protein
VFFSNEIAHADVTVDNSKGKLRVMEVEFQVTQRLRINHNRSTFDVLENRDHSGIAAGQSEMVTKRMTLDLSNIRYHCSQTKTKYKGIFSSQ